MFDDADEARAAALSADSQSFANWAAAAGNSIVIGGFCELGDDGKLYNSAVMVDATASWRTIARPICGTARS